MKRILGVLVMLFLLLPGCQTSDPVGDGYIIWIHGSQQNEALQDSAIKRLQEAKIDFEIDDKGNLIIREKDLDKAVMCCS